MGRPTVMTPHVIAKLEEAFAWGCSDVEACLWADIATDTLYKYQRENPEYIKRKAELKEKPILIARKSVVEGMKKDPKLAIDFLGRRKKDEFSPKVENDITSGGEKLAPLLVRFVGEDGGTAGNTNTSRV